MLSNAYFLAKFRFDTAENEPAKILQKICKMLLKKVGSIELLANMAETAPKTLAVCLPQVVPALAEVVADSNIKVTRALLPFARNII